MATHTSYLVLALLATSSVLVSSRPQESGAADVVVSSGPEESSPAEVVVSSGPEESSPAEVVVSSGTQPSSSGTFDLRTSGPHGFIIGDINVMSSHVAIKPKPKKKKPVRNEVEDVDGPRFSKFIGGPESEVSVAAAAPAGAGSSVAVASGPSLSISGGTITFNKQAEVVPIAGRN